MEEMTNLNRSIAGKVALVTGAASGMGRATALLFAREGAKVTALDRDEDGVKAVADEIKAMGGEALAIGLDITDGEGIKKAVADTAETFGALDILINNAGLAIPAPIDAENYEEAWDISMNVMLTAQVRFIRAALPHLRASSEGGRVVNIASTEGVGATAYNSPYVAAKHGVIGLTRALATELGREGMTFNCVCPGPIHTGITAGIQDDHKEIFAKRRVPLRRYGFPEEVAQVTLSCVLPAASYLNGVAIPVDGGMTIKNA